MSPAAALHGRTIEGEKARNPSQDTGRRFRSLRRGRLALILLAVPVVIITAVVLAVWVGRPTGSATSDQSPSSTRGGFETFSDDFAGESNRWDVVDDASHSFRYVDGTYQILTKQPGDYLSFLDHGASSSLRCRACVSRWMPGGSQAPRETGTAWCWYQRSGDLYVFNITNDGNYWGPSCFMARRSA